MDDSVEKSIGGRPYPRTEAPGAETPEKRLAIYSIDDSVENSMGGAVGGGHTLGQKLLVYKRLLLYSIDDQCRKF